MNDEMLPAWQASRIPLLGDISIYWERVDLDHGCCAISITGGSNR